jgi:phospholipid/cholesterol/gamma-HCH transport system permease protein
MSPARLDPTPGALNCSGDWTLHGIAGLERASLPQPDGPALILEAGGIGALDSAGALFLHRLRENLQAQGRQVEIHGLSEAHRDLLAIIEQAGLPDPHSASRAPQSSNPLADLGRATWNGLREIHAFLAFLGETALVCAHALLVPRRIRWQALFANLQSAGLNAMPIVGLMSFLIGVVLAYQGGSQLRLYGANIFIADLVGITLLRELAPMLTAIMVAGRTGSAFTAQIATMKITDEIDALRTLGISPMELLVVPKLFALMLALPLLTVFGDLMGLAGGMLIAWISLDVSFSEFLSRLQTPIMYQNYLIGIGKAPIFAIVVVLIGCYQGFRVSGGADSVGRQVTISVVQAIFLVIMVDAVFSVMFSWLGI